jgi:DNA modification methylase
MASSATAAANVAQTAGKPGCRLPSGVRLRPIVELQAYERNARTHSAEQVAQIAASIEEFGWTNPVLVTSAGEIIAGHGRVEAAKALGLAEVPVLLIDHLTAAQCRAYVIADNKIALNAGWDEDLLAQELQALETDGFDLLKTGFESKDIDELFAAIVETDEDGRDDRPDEDEPVEEPPQEPITRRGDLWILGAHRLLCGDSTNAADVARLLGEDRPHLMVTDPPYGVDYDPAWRNRADRANGKAYGARAVGQVLNDDRADWREAWVLFPGDVAYVWHAGVHSPTVAESLAVCEFDLRALIVWAKTRLVIGRGHYHHMHEPCWYAVRQGGNGHWSGDRKQTTLWQIQHVKSDTGHGTQKPVECMRRPILNNSGRGDLVYEPFAGSGTTIIAAESVGRRCLALELNPAYCDIIVRRWQTFARAEAQLPDGRTFAELELERSAD